MDNHNKMELQKGLASSFIDSTISSNLAYKSQFISNNYKQGRKVITSIESELLSCEEFYFSVAFITLGGITPLLPIFRELEKRNIKGAILTTNYLHFSEPRALNKLAEFKNIQIKMFLVEKGKEDFHTKGYLFSHGDFYKVIVGSSNMTLNALTKNKEWNTKLVSALEGEYLQEIRKEFNELWNSDSSLNYEQFIEPYSIEYEIIRKQQKITREQTVASLEAYRLTPNKMQIGFIRHLQEMIQEGEERALLISATGTGKTYASAFALREINPGKALFLVHREQIARQAIISFQKVFGKTRTFGLLSGNSKDYDVDFLFSTMNMMAREEVRNRFQKDEFQVIVIDEAHRIGSMSYQNIMNYYEPQFWLGMTASPERTDGFDVYDAFHHNIACEIRLQQALEEDLLCPFHYFGITDLQFNGSEIDEETNLRDFAKLDCDERVNYIIEQTKFYGFSGERVKGLVFCSSKKEAESLSLKFNDHGYRTIALTGEAGQEDREEAIERLVSDDKEDQSKIEQLDYIFTVDIFNEGVDIPELNQIIMLRPTKSPIVFVQQLGRGLRKSDEKEYVVIVDFIGNYKNNFMIPIALSGDRSYNKDNIRRYILEGERIIPGASTIHFDEIARKKIFSALDTANFTDIKLIRENYTNLKNKLGHIPKLLDFDQHSEMDILRIFDNPSLGSYYKFLVKYEKEYKVRLTEAEEKVIEFISKKLASGKRIHELELLNRLLSYQNGLMKMLKGSLAQEYHIELSQTVADNIVNVMTNQFSTGSGKKTYEGCIFIEKEEETEDYRITPEYKEMLKRPDFYHIVKELVEFGIERYRSDFADRYQDTNLVLYQKYTYEDVCRLLDWEMNEVPLNIGGYKFDRKTKTFPVFINYHKEDGIQDTIKYEDHFIDESKLIAISKQSRTLDSEDVQNFLQSEERGIKVELFVRKNKDDKISKEFYYLGRMKATGQAREFIMSNTNKTAVEIEWRLDTPVREDLFQYIINN